MAVFALHSALPPGCSRPLLQILAMRRLALLLIAPLLPLAAASAAEGMWQPHQLPELSARLAQLGLEMEPAALNDLTDHPMAAIVQLPGCSASFVSPDGLTITNHHCIQRTLQHNSTPEQNLLETGYLAETVADELPGGPGSRVLVTVAVSDVTSRMTDGLDADMAGLARFRAMEARDKELVAECERDAGHRCSVHSFYEGLEFYLIRQLEIRDVRLVYAPAQGIGNFGGEVDNWMWPRHTGDFSFLRAYVGPDGKPADYHEDNIAYQPEHYLGVSTRGLRNGGFAMAAGYPGRTYRHRLAIEAADVSTWFYPRARELYQSALAIIERETAQRPEAAIRYASLVSGLNNVIKNYGGMIEGFSRSGLVARKQRRESDLEAWLAANQEHADPEALSRLRSLVEDYRASREQRLVYDGFLRRRAALLDAAATLYRFALEREKPDAQRKPGFQERDRTEIRERLERLERSFDARVDRALLAHHLSLHAQLPENQRIAALDAWFGATEAGAIATRLTQMYRDTELDDVDTRLAHLDASAAQLRASRDPFMRLAVALHDSDIARENEADSYAGRFQYARSKYMSALAAWLASKGQPLYPDANGTLRVTFGEVTGYEPRDAVRYQPFTTLRGILEKNTGAAPFDSPPALLAAIEQRRTGTYAASGTVPVNFLATLDSTGGNSGSAVLDGHGELVGLLFDGNYESINADWYFDPAITRSICVDMRYVLWIMDTVDGAHRLLREMGIGPNALHARRHEH